MHQPYRLKKYQPCDVAVQHCYIDREADAKLINRLADDCYLPANNIILDLISRHRGHFKVSFSISGITLELLQEYRPDVIASFQQIIATGCAEILAETYYHSVSYLYSQREFYRQISLHAGLVKKVFGVVPKVFRNTELIYDNQLAQWLAGEGFRGVICEGTEKILQGRSPNCLYAAPDNGDFGLLLRNARLSDDIAFRFNDTNWSEHPLTAAKFSEWLHAHPADTAVINILLDYETFGLHKTKDSGIFEFLESLPAAVLARDRFTFSTPSAALEDHYPRDIYNVPQAISWEDKSIAGSCWQENVMQNNTLKKIYSLQRMVMNSDCEQSITTWGRLQAADYFYYMAKEGGKGSWGYNNPFPSAEEAFRNYSNIVTDFEISLIRKGIEKQKKFSAAGSFITTLF